MYNSPVDIWGAGCVIGELMTCGSPIFPGQSALQQLAMVRAARARAEDVKSEDIVGLPPTGTPDQWQPTFVALQSLRGSFATITSTAALTLNTAASSLRRSGSKASSRKLNVQSSKRLSQRADLEEDHRSVRAGAAALSHMNGPWRSS